MNLEPTRGWILYDDQCGFCRRWIPFWEPTLAKRGIAIAPLQDDWVRAKLMLPESDLLQDLRLLLADGDQIVGADVYRYVMKRIWWAIPFYVFSVLPICRRVSNWSYRMFATHRYCVSNACRLSGPAVQRAGSHNNRK